MSEIEYKVTVHCPICKHDHEVPAIRNIDANGNEEQKKKLENGTLFEFDCPDCGYSMRLSYSFVYEDTAVREYIYFSQEKPSQDAYSADQIIKNAKALCHGKTEDALLRITYSENDLKEKIDIFEQGLDDRIVEICKGIAVSQFPSTEDFFVSDIRYRNIGGKEVLALKCSDGTEQYVLEFNTMYDQMYSEYASMLPPLRGQAFECIDLDYAAAFLREL